MYIYIYVYIYIYLEPQLTSIFEGQPLQNKAFSNQNRGHLGSRYIFLGGETSNIWFLHPKIGEDEPMLTHISHMGVSTTN